MFPNPAVSICVTIIATIFFYGIGFPLSQRISEKSSKELSIPIGFAFFSVIATFINHLAGVGFIQSISIMLLCSLSASFALGKIPLGQICRRIFPKKLTSEFFLAIISSVVVCASLFVKIGINNEWYLSDPLFDHTKIAIIDSIVRTGLPIENPFSLTSPSGDIYLHYYYLWYLVAANISIIFDVSGWNSDIALTFITSFSSICVVFAVIKETYPKSKNAKYFSWLALLSSSIFWLISGNLFNNIYVLLRKEHALESWIIQASWVPQHLASASLVVISCFYLSNRFNAFTWDKIAIFSIIIASGVGASTWVGGITFGVISSILFVFELICNKNYQQIILKWSSVAVFSLILSSPLLINQLSVANSLGKSPIGLSVYDISVFGPFGDIIVFIFVFLPICFPIISIPFYIHLIKLALPTFKSKISYDEKKLIIISSGSVLTSLFFCSQIANNDLGWRAIIPMLLSGAVLSSRIFDVSRKNKLAILFYMLTGVSFISTLTFGKMLLIGGVDYKSDNDFSAYLDVKNMTLPSDRVLLNVRKYYGKEIFDGNIIPTLLVNRNQCFQNVTFTLAFGSEWKNDIWSMWDVSQKIYSGIATRDEMNMLTKFQCNKLIVMPGDKIWTYFPYSNDGWKLDKYNDKVKIYTR
ncbi:TPA: hypothetical protein ACNE2E_005090 [Escherichia coli]|uniref:hypothetical protein n=1 Tax=Escherichia coli TaxID=562 RepID=UPI0022A16809|nr:hypothetical protein [Escherichia coli]EKR7174325.1 hypothetical protein [Escherichia coli]MDP4344688.1 hypothetical protein [Escherichia coli]MDP4370783.1 hypothetical protein [Escherichia coli]HCN1811242.1 hypothetical protein [Escherichia coli]HCU5420161.1 hypothetical protein [Escherichia coli]